MTRRGRLSEVDPTVSRAKLLALQLLVALAAVLLWQLFTTVPIGGVKLLPPFFFSTPTDVAARIVKWFVEGTIWKHLWITLVESVLAFVIGSVAGVLIGVWFAQQPRVAADRKSTRLNSSHSQISYA